MTEDDLLAVFPNAQLVYIPADHATPTEETPEETAPAEESTEVKEEADEAAEVKEEAEENAEEKNGEEETTEAKTEEKKEPKKQLRIKSKRYAYVCFATTDEVTAVAGTEIEINDHEYKVFKLEVLPPVDAVIRAIDAERLGNLSGPLNSDKKARLYNLRRQAMHYIRTEYLSEKKMQNLQKVSGKLE